MCLKYENIEFASWMLQNIPLIQMEINGRFMIRSKDKYSNIINEWLDKNKSS